jgi:hypothetical protein
LQNLQQQQHQYELLTIKFFNLIQNEFDTAISSYKLISNELTLVTIQDDIKWPFFISPYFALQTRGGHGLAVGVEQIICPIVQTNQRKQWEQFAINNSDWINDGQYQTSTSYGTIAGLYFYKDNELLNDHHEIIKDRLGFIRTRKTQATSTSRSKTNTIFVPANVTVITNASATTVESIPPTTTTTINEPIPATKTNSSSIFPTITRVHNGTLVQQTDPNPFYAPMWQMVPLQLNLVNYDLLSTGANTSFTHMLQEQHQQQPVTVLSPTIYPTFDPANVSSKSTQPYAAFLTPIFKTFQYNDPTDIVGLLSSLVPLSHFFETVYRIQGSFHQVNLVLIDQVNTTYTYRIDGPTVRKKIWLFTIETNIFLFYIEPHFCNMI